MIRYLWNFLLDTFKPIPCPRYRDMRRCGGRLRYRRKTLRGDNLYRCTRCGGIAIFEDRGDAAD